MRIISWNCCWQKEGFTDEKRNEILKLNPDILIVQECKQDDWQKLNYSEKTGHWYGDGKESQGNPNKNLGIGIFCNNKFSIDCSLFKDLDLSNMRYALPYIIKYKDEEVVTLFSVWAKSGYEYYHVPIFNSLEYFYTKIKSSIVLVGDFNTGSQYNNKKNGQYYENIKRELKTKYHLENCAFWQEWLPTFHREENEDYNFYLDDHCFSLLSSQVVSFGMGAWRHWSKYSDHIPLIIDFDDDFLKNPELCQLIHFIRTNDQWQQTSKELREELAGHYTIPTLKYGNYIKEI
jgi:exonuclease III